MSMTSENLSFNYEPPALHEILAPKFKQEMLEKKSINIVTEVADVIEELFDENKFDEGMATQLVYDRSALGIYFNNRLYEYFFVKKAFIKGFSEGITRRGIGDKNVVVRGSVDEDNPNMLTIRISP